MTIPSANIYIFIYIHVFILSYIICSKISTNNSTFCDNTTTHRVLLYLYIHCSTVNVQQRRHSKMQIRSVLFSGSYTIITRIIIYYIIMGKLFLHKISKKSWKRLRCDDNVTAITVSIQKFVNSRYIYLCAPNILYGRQRDLNTVVFIEIGFFTLSCLLLSLDTAKIEICK